MTTIAHDSADLGADAFVPGNGEAPKTAEDESKYRRRPLDWRTLADGEPPLRDWAIDHWVGMGHVTLLAGKGGVEPNRTASRVLPFFGAPVH